MKNFLFISLVIYGKLLFACDVCGCAMGGFSMGITPQKSSNYFGVNYNHAAFNASIQNNSIYFPDENSFDTYQSIDLFAKINLKKRLSLFGVLPYGFNLMDGSHQDAQTQGLKDLMLIGLYTLMDIKPDSSNKNWHHLMSAGFGGKAPTGEFELRDVETNGIINPNFQLGSGSWDAIAVLNYKTKFKRVGLSTEQVFKYNGENELDYRFGNQYNLTANMFTWWFNKGFSFLPYSGIYYESSGVHTQKEISVSNSGGNATFVNLGALLIYNNWGLGIDAKAPISQNFNTDSNVSISGEWRWKVTFRYYFEKFIYWK